MEIIKVSREAATVALKKMELVCLNNALLLAKDTMGPDEFSTKIGLAMEEGALLLHAIGDLIDRLESEGART